MLSLSTLASRLLKQGDLQPIYRVDFGDEFDPVTPSAYWLGSFLYSPVDVRYVLPVPMLVTEIPSGLSQQLALMEGTGSSGSMVVSIDDHPSVRALVKDNPLLGKDLVVVQGFDHPDWVHSDWIPKFRGVIRDVEFGETLKITATTFDISHAHAAGAGQMNSMEIPFGSGIITPDTYDFGGSFVSIAEPVQCLADMLTALEIPTRFVNASSFDPSASPNLELSHLRVYRTDDDLSDKRIKDRVDAKQLMRELAATIRGFLFFDEGGQMSFKLLDVSGGADATWDADDLVPIPENTRTRFDDLATSVRVNTILLGGLTAKPAAMGWGAINDSDYQLSIQAGDIAEILSWNFSGPPPAFRGLQREIVFNDNWFGAGGQIMGAYDVASPATLTFTAFGNDPLAQPVQITLNSANGFGWPGIGTVNPVSAARPIYVAIVDPTSLHYAIVQFTGLSYIGQWPNGMQATGGTFVDGDNSIADAVGGHLICFDVTAAWQLVDYMLDTFVDTAARLSLKGKPHTYEVQLGDLVGLDIDRYVDYGFDGDPGSSLFLVVGKDQDPGDLSIQWELMRVRTNSPTPELLIDDSTFFDGKKAITGLFTQDGDAYDLVGADTESGFSPFVETGLQGTAPGGLLLTISEGYCGTERWKQHSPEFGRTLTASKDTYAYARPGARMCPVVNWEFIEVANLAPPPVTPAGAIPILRARTDGAAITGIVDLRNRGIIGTRGLKTLEQVTQLGADFLGDCSIGGFALTPGAGGGSGLVHTINTGQVSRLGTRIARLVDESHTFTASRLTWIDIDNDGVLFYTEQALATDEPPLSATDRVRICVVETDAADVVHVGYFPQNRTVRSRALSPEAIRDGLTPNGLLDDLGVANGIPFGWEKSEGANVTISTVAGTDVKCGRYGVKFDVGAAGGTSYFRGIEPLGVFPISPLQTYTGKVFYTMGAGYVRGPTMSIGLEFFDQDMKTIAVRNFISAAAVPAMDNRPQGNVLTGSFTGVGGGANQIPDTARYAKWVVQADLNALGASGIILSGFVLSEP